MNIPENIGDNHETTTFLNKGSYSAEEIRAYPYSLRKSYVATFKNDAYDDLRRGRRRGRGYGSLRPRWE